MSNELRIGLIVTHPKKPEWGPGRVLDLQGTHAIVYFRDIPGDDPNLAVRTLDLQYASLNTGDVQSDPLLDNLPPYRDGRFVHATAKRVTIEQAIEKFHAIFPLYFEDAAYIGEARSTPSSSKGERAYKWAAHELFKNSLGDGKLGALLSNGAIDEIRRLALTVERRTNLLAVFEKAALSDALEDIRAATEFFRALDQVLSARSIVPSHFSDYLRAVKNLPSSGKTGPAKWTVATIFPYLAQPDHFMFLKPEVTQQCAARLTFDLAYSSDLNWSTYERLLVMSRHA